MQELTIKETPIAANRVNILHTIEINALSITECVAKMNPRSSIILYILNIYDSYKDVSL